MTISTRLANWASEISSAHTPKAREAAKQAILDVVGCMVAGAGDSGAAKVREAFKNMGVGYSVVCGSFRKAPAPYAALANGMAAHALDFDDTFMEAVTHASASLVPALFALGDELDVRGDTIIDAYIVGLEIHGALGLALNRSHYDQGWHSTATLGVIGTAAACARVMGLDQVRFAHALNLAFSSAAGTKVQFGSMAKPLHAGLAAKNAIEAAKLAAAGVEGRANAFEGPMGLMELYGGSNPPGWDAAFEKFGGKLAIERQGLTVKRFPCCAATHRAVDAVLDLMKKHGFEASNVEHVDTWLNAGHVKNLRYLSPETEFEARFSMQYCVAVALLSGTITLSDFTPIAVQRQEVKKLCKKISITPHEISGTGASEIGSIRSMVRIALKDGRILEGQSHTPKGDAANPLNNDEREAKFLDCCLGFLPHSHIDRLKTQIVSLDSAGSIRHCTRLLRFEAGADQGQRFEQRA
ncbi:MAG: hypothetical protein CBB68_05925 [Rhodospirillaceae bacterium TMED8]|nr:MmgE/PrpD family protein [Magnetovibrio sp.]OUT51165.1 MAG: hypothetical protein CBB68_05925 [Rhodospirillaceae bacterium TMED8]